MTTWGESMFLTADGKLRAGWRFSVSLFVVFGTDFLAGQAVGLVHFGGVLIREIVYRGVTLILLLLGFALLLRVFDRVPRRPLSAMGLASDRTLLQSLWGALLGAAMIVICVVTIAIVGTLDVQIALSYRSLTRALLALVLLGVAAMGEEVTFRGYPFQKLVEATSPAGAIAITSAFFGLVHAGNPHASGWAVANTILFGVLLAAAYLRTRSLWLPWGIHFGWNAALGLGFGLPMSGLRIFAIVIKSRASGAVWLTGGAYGIEGSVLGTAIIAVGTVAVFWITSLAPLQPATAARAAEVPVMANETSSPGIPS